MLLYQKLFLFSMAEHIQTLEQRILNGISQLANERSFLVKADKTDNTDIYLTPARLFSAGQKDGEPVWDLTPIDLAMQYKVAIYRSLDNHSDLKSLNSGVLPISKDVKELA